MDKGHEMTEDILKRLEKDVTMEYRQALDEISAKVEDYFRRYEIKDKTWQRWVREGKKTPEEYKKWRIGQLAVGERWKEFRDGLARDLTNADKIARSIAEGYMPEVYALNHNYATFQVEQDGMLDTSYSLYSRETVERLMREEGFQLLPTPGDKTDWGRDLRWNAQHLRSTLLQGIIQGESIPELTKRVESVGGMDHRAAIRNARTMVTNAQNAGRYDAFERAQNLGVDLVIEWQATLDGRTRHSHRMMHGQRRAIGEPFEVDRVKILYPGYPEAPQEQIWNCRCTLLSWVKGFEGDTVKSSPKMNGMSFEEWLKATPKSQRLEVPEKKAEARKWKYIERYRNL